MTEIIKNKASLRDKKPAGSKGDWIDIETYQTIWDDVCDWFDGNIDQLVKNTQEVYALTGNEVGYSALKNDWEFRRSWKGVGDLPKFSEDDIRNNIIDKMYGPLCWLWQKNMFGKSGGSFSEGFTGLLVTFRLNVQEGDDLDDFGWDYSFSLSLNISAGGNNTLRKTR